MNDDLARRRILFQSLDRHFNEEELKTLCFYLAVDYESLGGEGKNGKIRELILFLERTNRVNEIIRLAAKERPNTELAKLIEGEKASDGVDRGQLIYEFKLLCAFFYGGRRKARNQVALEIAKIADKLSLEEVLSFANSAIPGERVGAAIGLRIKISTSAEYYKDSRVLNSVTNLLSDVESFVRYRAVEAIYEHPLLLDKSHNDLLSLANDHNKGVRRIARQALANSSPLHV